MPDRVPQQPLRRTFSHGHQQPWHPPSGSPDCALEAAAEPRFVVIDGAQDFCHGEPNLSENFCDLYLTGSHKWLKGYHPMGIAFYGHRRSRSFVQTALDRLLDSGRLDDPLLRFIRKMRNHAPDGVSETV